MTEREVDRQLAQLLSRGLGLSREQENALWADFTQRAAQEAAAWAAFATGLARASRRLQAVLPHSVWPGWFLSRG